MNSFVPGQNRLFQPRRPTLNDRSRGTPANCLVSGDDDFEDLEHEYQRIVDVEKKPAKLLSTMTDFALRHNEQQLTQEDSIAARLPKSIPRQSSFIKHTITDDIYNDNDNDSDEDYDPVNDNDYNESDSDEEDNELYKKEILADKRNLQNQQYPEQPPKRNFFIHWITRFFFLISQLIFGTGSRGILTRATLLGVLLSASVYFLNLHGSKVSWGLVPATEWSSNIGYDLGDMSKRLKTMEREIQSLSLQSNIVQTSSESISRIETQIKELFSSVASLSNVNEVTSGKVQNFEVSLASVEKQLADTSQDFLSILKSGSQNQDAQTSDQGVAPIDPALFMKVSDSIEKAGQQIELLHDRVRRLEQTEVIEKAVVDVLDQYLPARLVVQFDPQTGSITAVPEFWKYLSTQLLERNIGSASNEALSDQTSFKEYMTQNQKAIEDYLKSYLDNNYEPDKESENSALVSKEVFKEMLRRELEALRDETLKELEKFDQRVHHDVKNMIGSVHLTSGSDSSSSENILLPSELADLAQNETAQATLNLLVKKSIQRYISHTISKPDFADPASGAKIIPHLTSHSYDWKNGLGFSDRQLHKLLGVLGFGRMKVNRPLTAFNNDVKLGSCWPFNGPKGRIGVSLGKMASLTDVGIVHVRADQSPNPTSAPRIVSIYIQVEDPELRETIIKLVLENTEDTDINIGDHDDDDKNDQLQQHQKQGFLKLPEDYVKIMTIEYDLFHGEEFQVFPVPSYIKRLKLVTSKAVFSIENNWGHEEFTCIYRFRLFGEIAKIPEPALPTVVEPEVLPVEELAVTVTEEPLLDSGLDKVPSQELTF